MHFPSYTHWKTDTPFPSPQSSSQSCQPSHPTTDAEHSPPRRWTAYNKCHWQPVSRRQRTSCRCWDVWFLLASLSSGRDPSSLSWGWAVCWGRASGQVIFGLGFRLKMRIISFRLHIRRRFRFAYAFPSCLVIVWIGLSWCLAFLLLVATQVAFIGSIIGPYGSTWTEPRKLPERSCVQSTATCNQWDLPLATRE